MAMFISHSPQVNSVEQALLDIAEYCHYSKAKFLVVVPTNELIKTFKNCQNTQAVLIEEGSGDTRDLAFSHGNEYDRIYIFSELGTSQINYLISRLRNPRSTCPKQMFVYCKYSDTL